MQNRTTVVVVVNGAKAEVEGNINAPIKSLIERALHETSNVGQPAENWVLRDAGGNELDLNTKIGAIGSGPLFLDLGAGAGG